MRTLYPILLILAIGTAGIMWSTLGVGGAFGTQDPVDDLESTDEVEDRSQDLEDADDDSGDGFFSVARDRVSDSLVGAIISAAGQIVGFAKLAILLPLELQRLGIPGWIAVPGGLIAQAISFIGFLQFVTGREYR